MKISEICIKRPVLSIVISIAIIMLGVVAGWRLQVRQLPKIEPAVISVQTDYPGASPQVIETQITKVLEGVLSRIEGVNYMTSSSTNDQSTVVLHFHLNRPIEHAANDIRDAISRIRSQFPEDTSEPTIRKNNADERPIIALAIYSDKMPPREIADYVSRYVQNEFEIIDGVSTVSVVGGGEYVMNIYLDPEKLAAHHLTASDVRQALVRQNLEQPAGRIISHDVEFLVTVVASLNKPSEFEDIVIHSSKDKIVKIRDVGCAKLEAPEKRNDFWFKGKQAVGLQIIKQSIANPLEIGNQVKKILPKIVRSLPRELKIDIAVDNTVFIKESIDEVYQTLFEATLLVIAVVFVFLWSMRSAIIPLVAIPVSLIGSLIFLYSFSFSLNTLTLLAMVLAIGLVVDDAIVILENVYSKIEKGMNSFKAAYQGTKEISFAVIAMTLTLVSVYTPIALSTGITGRLFREFAIALAGAVLLSGLVALTLSPMMCAWLLRAPKHKYHGNDGEHIDKEAPFTLRFLHSLEQQYELFLRKSLEFRWLIVIIGVLFAGGGYVVMQKYMPHETAPAEDRGILRINSLPPQGVTLEYAQRYARQLDDILSKIPDLERRVVLINTPEVSAMAQLRPWKERTLSTRQIAEQIKNDLESISGILFYALDKSSVFSGGDANKIEFVLQTAKPHEYLIDMSNFMTFLLHRYPGVMDIMASTPPPVLDYVVQIDRGRASTFGVDVRSIADMINALIGGKRSGHFISESKKYDVKIELEDNIKRTPDVISSLYIRGEKENMVPLSDMVNVLPRSAAVQIDHFNQLRSISFSAKIAPGFDLGQAVDKIQEIVEEFMPDDVRLDFAGETRSFMQESSNMLLIFGLALAFIFLVLAAQFESFVDPFIIMLTVPLSMAGAVLTLKLAGGSVNIFSQIGFVTLIGLITKHGILIVDFANKLREQGEDKFVAVIKASKSRLRPILMTTFAMVLGAVPLARASGAGAESRQQIGWVIVGGMTIGTIFTLLVVPAVYTYLSRARRQIELN